MVDPFGLIYAVLRFPESGRRDWEADQEKAHVIAATSSGSGVLQGKLVSLSIRLTYCPPPATGHRLRVLSETGESDWLCMTRK